MRFLNIRTLAATALVAGGLFTQAATAADSVSAPAATTVSSPSWADRVQTLVLHLVRPG